MSKLVIKNTQPTNAQKQLLNAMAEIFDGKNIRYAVKGNDVMFVCKDVVEAAGGTWNATRFKEVIGDGFTTDTPIIDSLGPFIVHIYQKYLVLPIGGLPSYFCFSEK